MWRDAMWRDAMRGEHLDGHFTTSTMSLHTAHVPLSFMGVMQRNLKPDNFLPVSKVEDATVKAADLNSPFRLRQSVGEGTVRRKRLRRRAGGAAYELREGYLRVHFGQVIGSIYSLDITVLNCSGSYIWTHEEHIYLGFRPKDQGSNQYTTASTNNGE